MNTILLRMKNNRTDFYRSTLLCILLAVILAMAGCGAPGDPIVDNLYTQNVYPGTASTYSVGSEDLPYSEGWFDEITVADNIATETITYTGDYWDDLRTPANAVKVPGVKAPTWTAFRGGLLLGFSDQAVAGNEEEVYFALQLPHSYKEGTDIKIHVHYTPDANTVGDIVRWGLESSWASPDTLFPASATIYANTIPTNNDGGWHRLATFPDTPGSVQSISSMLVCRLFRNSSDATDNYTGSALLLEIDAHFLIDAPGSREVSAK